jgi:transcriptional antiterminator
MYQKDKKKEQKLKQKLIKHIKLMIRVIRPQVNEML